MWKVPFQTIKRIIIGDCSTIQSLAGSHSKQRKLRIENLMTLFPTRSVYVQFNKKTLKLESRDVRKNETLAVSPHVESNRDECVNRSMSGNRMRQNSPLCVEKILFDYDKRRRR